MFGHANMPGHVRGWHPLSQDCFFFKCVCEHSSGRTTGERERDAFFFCKMALSTSICLAVLLATTASLASPPPSTPYLDADSLFHGTRGRNPQWKNPQAPLLLASMLGGLSVLREMPTSPERLSVRRGLLPSQVPAIGNPDS